MSGPDIQSFYTPGATGAFRISFDDYVKIDAVNCSSLKWAAISAKHYLFHKLEDEGDSKAKGIGRATHTAVLEPELWNTQYVKWTGAQRRGKVWDAFQNDPELNGREILTQTEWDSVARIAAAVAKDAEMRARLSQGYAELTLVWKDEPTGLLCKARPDFLRLQSWQVDDHFIPAGISDVKTTSWIAPGSRPGSFGKQAAELKYHWQAAWYRNAVAAVFGQVLPFDFCAVESKPPHDTAIFEVPTDVVLEGEHQTRKALEQLAEWHRDNHWPGVTSEVETLELPAWAFTADMELDLDHQGAIK